MAKLNLNFNAKPPWNETESRSKTGTGNWDVNHGPVPGRGVLTARDRELGHLRLTMLLYTASQSVTQGNVTILISKT